MLFPRLPNIRQTERQRHVTQVLYTMPLYGMHQQQPQQSQSNYTIAFHNGQGCFNKLDHYCVDTFYFNIDILCLMELHSPLNGRLIPTFQAPLEIPSLQRNGTGIALFIKHHLSTETLLSERFYHNHATIELQAIRLYNTLLIFLYCNPQTSPLFLHQTLDSILHNLINQLQQTRTIHCLGDFNNACNEDNMVYFALEYYGLLLQTTSVPTHQSGSHLDKALSNCPIQLHLRPTYSSDHSTVWFSLQEN